MTRMNRSNRDFSEERWATCIDLVEFGDEFVVQKGAYIISLVDTTKYTAEHCIEPLSLKMMFIAVNGIDEMA